MKVLRDGKEVENAQVIFRSSGEIDTVRINGVHYDPSVFDFKDAELKERTKDGKEEQAKKPVEKTAKKSK